MTSTIDKHLELVKGLKPFFDSIIILIITHNVIRYVTDLISDPVSAARAPQLMTSSSKPHKNAPEVEQPSNEQVKLLN